MFFAGRLPSRLVPRDGPQSNLGPDVPCLHPVVFGSVVFGSVPSFVLTILFSAGA